MAAKSKEKIVRYIGESYSYTVGDVRFTKKNKVKEMDADLASIVLKYGCFEEVKENEQPSSTKKGGGTSEETGASATEE
ncbi:hypothetical protein [Anaerophilus nitritogenes]|uniref:hypothetical protein n=1 Tax=Anaerophilus nitritogenes TaxID=2498136 RepID=UPI00101B88DC|nr:hypothetical protein [Anaerophilus nitritogenes]